MVYNVLMSERDHPSAEQVFLRVKQELPDISMATVYNCLDALVKCRLVNEVNVDRGATRYCPNMKEHCHFYCDDCGKVFDIDRPFDCMDKDLHIPMGFKVNSVEIAVRGTCGGCEFKD